MDRYQEIKLAVIRIRHSARLRTDGRAVCGDGGPGSGHWGHKGRKGKVGGSEKESGGGRGTEDKGKDTPFQKKKKELLKAHPLTKEEVLKIADTSDSHKYRIVDEKGENYKVVNPLDLPRELRFTPKYGVLKGYNEKTGELKDFKAGDVAGIIIPNSMDADYTVTEDDKEAIRLGKERFKKAFYANSPEEVDDIYREQTGKIWKGCTKRERDIIFSYTASRYEYVNDALRRGDTSDKALNRQIKVMTKFIGMSEIKEDMILRRGISIEAAEKMFGVPEGFLSSEDGEEVSMTGRFGTDEGFMSTGAAKGTGFDSEFNMEILVPKGTKGMYLEPVSAYGKGEGYDWDGENGQDIFSKELEILLQRGCTLQVIEHRHEEGKHDIKAVLVRQEPTGFGAKKPKKTA